jgi:hypothetical protein
MLRTRKADLKKRLKEDMKAGRKVTRKDIQDAMGEDDIYIGYEVRGKKRPWDQEPWDDGVLDKE